MKRFFNSTNTESKQDTSSSNIQMLFYFVALTAQLAEIDSKTNEKEMNCIYSFFPNFLNVKRKIDLLYSDAIEENLSTIFLTSKINKIKAAGETLCQDICVKLLILADSDSPVNNLEFNLITQIAIDFGFSRDDVENWLERSIIKSGANDYEILNLDETASIKEVSDTYRELAMKFHPDKLFSHDDIHPICMEAYKKRYDMISNAYKNLKSNVYI
jgi:DnaJ like chaperone protein